MLGAAVVMAHCRSGVYLSAVGLGDSEGPARYLLRHLRHSRSHRHPRHRRAIGGAHDQPQAARLEGQTMAKSELGAREATDSEGYRQAPSESEKGAR